MFEINDKRFAVAKYRTRLIVLLFSSLIHSFHFKYSFRLSVLSMEKFIDFQFYRTTFTYMSRYILFIVNAFAFLKYDIWRITEYELSRSRRFSYRLVKTLILAIRGFIEDRLVIRASALTYSILFAMIPLFALVIGISKGFGVEKFIEEALNDTFIGQTNMIPMIMGFVERYLKTTQTGLFIGVGLVILFWSVMAFFMRVENAFNSIWQVKKSRSFIRQFATYFSSIMLIPLLIVFSSGISIYINSTLAQTYLYDVLSPFLRFGFKFVPYLINWFVFTVMYMVIPNTRVHFKNALIAGIVAGSAFQFFQLLYIHGQVYLSRFNVVYGSFAAVPLLLLWLQISCLIVLLGAEISYASQNVQNYDYEVDTKKMSIRYRNFLTLFLTHIVVKRFEEQKNPLTAEEIAYLHRVPIRVVRTQLMELVEVGVLSEVYTLKPEKHTYQPAIDINQLTVSLLFEKLEQFGTEEFLNKNSKALNDFWNKNLKINRLSNAPLNEILVKDI